ncbi:MAG: HAMP domain-containing histidine kinase [Clostridia bacterium]|nr:HAMP domain-containing histidine kinase [Clostridia bacterium]
MKKRRRKLSETNQLRLAFIFGVAAILLIAIALVTFMQYVFFEVGLFYTFTLENSPFAWVVMFATISIILGLGMTFIFEKVILKPFYTLLDGLESLSKGKFSTRIDSVKVAGVRGISEKFNALAEELENTEILRSDFINDFSHEFKTPIVSVRSLITLMKNGNISKEKQQQYLIIIEDEIDRLSVMTTNILNLTKIENQGILTGQTQFNLSEQLRTCLLLLEKKWAKKSLQLDVDFDEYSVVANEDMLKQIWFNLLDNAIKFAYKSGKIKIDVEKTENKVVVCVANEGPEIPKEEYDKIFQKFYQTKYATKKDGNGIGLSIVKHIVDLHGGRVSAKSEDGWTFFTVELPA